MFKIARFAVIDAYRNKKKMAMPDKSNEMVDYQTKIEATQGVKSIKAIIDTLPSKYAKVLILLEFQGLTQVEISKAPGISLSCAKSRLLRAKKTIGQET